jgi:putative membrane protein insertion efficiency factor
MNKISLKFLEFYQKFLTVLGFGSCRYYPTCSEYAMWQFEKNNFFKAFYFTTIRILKCNQLFEGGFDYPIIKKNLKTNRLCHHNQDKKLFFVKFYLIAKDEHSYYLIKRFKGKIN